MSDPHSEVSSTFAPGTSPHPARPSQNRAAPESGPGDAGGEGDGDLASRLTDRIPPPTITAAGVGMTAAGWVLYAVLYALLLTRAEDIPFAGALLGQLLECLLLGAASLPVWWLTVRKMDAASAVATTATHAVIAPLFAWGTLEVYLGLMNAIAGPTITSEISDQYQWVFVSHLTLYIIEFAAFHLFRSMKRLRWRERQAAEYASLARERELAALKAQINPHFLFNTFNSISATVHVAPEEARQMLADLADLFRYALDSTDDDAVPLADEIEFAKSYLDLEAHRFHDRLEVRYAIDVPDDALDVRVPPMILQPLVENAIKHGISPSEDGGTVTVSVTRSDPPSGALRVEVADTGVGPDADVEAGPIDAGIEAETDAAGDAPAEPGAARPARASSTGVGLSNTNRRLIHAFGLTARLHTASVSPHGFRVWFRIPT
jgi:signal transduction histidine kinase